MIAMNESMERLVEAVVGKLFKQLPVPKSRERHDKANRYTDYKGKDREKEYRAKHKV